MFSITYNKNGETKTEEFESYMDLVFCVASNKIKDNDFVSMVLGEQEFNSLDSFADYVANGITLAKEMAEDEEDELN